MLDRIRSSIPPGLAALIGRGRHVAGSARNAPHLAPSRPGSDERSGRHVAPQPPTVSPQPTVPRTADLPSAPWRSTPARVASLAIAVAITVGLGTVVADHSAAEPTRTRAVYRPTSTSGWRNDATLGRTTRADQYAEATVSGLRDARYSAGFRMRYADRASQVLVAISGTGWLIQASDGAAMTGAFAHASSGVFRAEIEGLTVRVRWNGAVVASRRVAGRYPGRHVVTTVRQPSASVALRTIRASSLPVPTTTVTPQTPVFGPGGTWWSGAAGDDAAAGSFGTWRGSTLTMGGTWTDTYDAVTDQWTICRGPWSTWNKPLDLAVGALYHSRGETWAAAARGAYTARWTASLTKIKTCWGGRDPGLLNLRFAHEMNLASIPWSVHKGEEASFVAAMKLFSDLRYQIIPGAKLVFCPNDGTDTALGGLDIRSLWPGKDAKGRIVANVFGVDSYNGWPHVTTAAAFTTKINASYPNGAPRGIERYRQLAASLGAPFAVPEWSNNGDPKSSGGGGESPVYIQQFNAWARAHAGNPASPLPGQLLYEVHFNLWTQYQFWPTTIQPKTAATYRSVSWGR